MNHSVSVLHFAEARAREIASLMNQVNSSEKSKKKTWFQNLPHHMRRRGASQNPKRVPKNLRVSNQNAAAKPSGKSKKRKKKPKNLQAEYATRSKPDNTWLEIHIWHAKRFKMKNLWGYQLPLHSNDRKQGSSCAAATHRAMHQDLSYYCCIELNGLQEKLLEHLSTLADPMAGHTFSSEMFLDGSKEGHSFLYHPNSCPYRAIGPVSFIWKPRFDENTNGCKSEISSDNIRKLWVWCHPSIHDELVQVLVNIFDFEEIKNSKCDSSDPNEMETDNNETEVEPVHKFTFTCKLNFTKSEKYFCKEKRFTSSDINMVLRKNTLVRHRLIGPMSMLILSRVLQLADVTKPSGSDLTDITESSEPDLTDITEPDETEVSEPTETDLADVTEPSEPEPSDIIEPSEPDLVIESSCKTKAKKFKVGSTDASNDIPESSSEKKFKASSSNDLSDANEDDDPESSSESSTKKFKPDSTNDLSDASGNDPASSQLWWKSYYKNENRKLIHSRKGELLQYFMNSQSSYYVTPQSVIGLTVKDPRIELGWDEENEKDSTDEFSHDSSVIDQLLTPETADSPLWEDDIRNEVTATKMSDQELNKLRAHCIGTVELGDKESKVPILIIHQSGLNGFGTGWDIIAPRGWSLEFWRAFERKGSRPCGLRDLQIVNLECGRPNFPCSFPDTEAGATYEEHLRTEELTQFYRHPKSKRPNFTSLGIKTPFFMSWSTLINDWEKIITNPEIGDLFPSFENLVSKGNNDSEESSEYYYVLRQKELRRLGNLCGRLNRTPRSGMSEEAKDKLSDDFNSFVMAIPPQIHLGRSLIVLKIHCMNKGSPSKHSGLYLLNAQDLDEVKNSRQFSRPTEPLHPYMENPQMDERSLERPEIDSLISVASRKMVGYVSEGGFSRLTGQGYAIGHCSSVGFLVMWKQCLEAQLRPLLLVREQHCFKYRVGTVEIVENYL